MNIDSDLLERLDKEITEQTRNGRTEVYISVEDLNKLGYGIDPNKTGRAYVDVTYLQLVLKNYKFRNQLKVNPEKTETFKQLEQDIKSIETRTVDGDREDI